MHALFVRSRSRTERQLFEAIQEDPRCIRTRWSCLDAKYVKNENILPIRKNPKVYSNISNVVIKRGRRATYLGEAESRVYAHLQLYIQPLRIGLRVMRRT